MTSPSVPITVRCTQCRSEYREWIHRTAHALEDDEIACPEVSVCPECGARVDCDGLVAWPGGSCIPEPPAAD